MDNLITSIIGAVIFIWFTAGLAESIGEIPFFIIVAVVIVLLLIDIYQTARAEFSSKKPNND